ncbi:MAG TPA: glycoside hydrolase family 172 protein [Rhodothermales bacterium]|nr:glycoside hydrolase family 172 protein [Rhodothermales bacterium]
MHIDLSTLYLKREAESRSISAENPDGARGGGAQATPETTLHPPSAHHARDLGSGWKVSPCRSIAASETVTIMDHAGPGVIRHIWITCDSRFYRDAILRIYWDGAEQPSVECPIGDLFCCAWKERQNILAQPVNVNPSGGMNMYFPMPFREHARITVENEAAEDLAHFFYTINFTLEPVSADALYFHAQWRRTNPLPYQTDYVMLDGVRGQGQYVGTFMAWQQNNKGWWGEGEIKMYLDGDTEYPTICGTGTEDYFGGAWCFGENYSAPYLGYQKISGTDVGSRMTMYRFHVLDPVFFKQDLRVTMQALGWRKEQRYLPLQDDIASVVYWYQTLPHAPFPSLPSRDAREII